jgi:hypothetical protein
LGKSFPRRESVFSGRKDIFPAVEALSGRYPGFPGGQSFVLVVYAATYGKTLLPTGKPLYRQPRRFYSGKIVLPAADRLYRYQKSPAGNFAL